MLPLLFAPSGGVAFGLLFSVEFSHLKHEILVQLPDHQ